MAKTKYKEYYERMVESDPGLFEEFTRIHAEYVLQDGANQEEYNRIGAKVKELAYEWENRLCHHTEGGQYAKYAGNLAEKFQGEIKKNFPMFDHIGLKVVSPPSDSKPRDFSIKKINLN